MNTLNYTVTQPKVLIHAHFMGAACERAGGEPGASREGGGDDGSTPDSRVQGAEKWAAK